MLAESGLGDEVARGGGLLLTEPLGYLDFLRLYSGARLVLTDSGGIQEETTALGIPCPAGRSGLDSLRRTPPHGPTRARYRPFGRR